MFELPKYGHGIGFRRLLEYCDSYGLDLDAIGRNAVVITGSNGKGSTARFVYECLRANRERVGCFISPHLFAVNERFELSGTRIDDAALHEYAARAIAFHKKLRERGDALGAFEALFLIALSWFHDRKVSCAVWEAGIGGRYDPVRVLRSPISALTSVDLEHTEVLGATRQAIAFDKLDATRAGGRTFVSPAVSTELAPELKAFARVTGRTLEFISLDAITNVVHAGNGMRYTLANTEVTIPLLGIHQVHNSATALQVAEAFLGEWNRDAALCAIAQMQWAGRLEKIADDPETWIDVGHTPEAITRTCATLAELFNPEELLVVFGVSANKAVHEIASIVQRHFRHVLVTQAYKYGSDAHSLAQRFEPSQLAGVATRIEDAVERAQTIAQTRGWKVAVVGGLFLSIEFTHTMRGGDPRRLNFF